jgi:TolB protein
MNKRVLGLAVSLILLAAVAASAPSIDALAKPSSFTLASTIVFSSTRDNPTFQPVMNAGEVYLVNPDGTNLRRLTFNSDGTTSSAADGFATISPDGKRIVFVSNRNRAASEPINTSDLFLMKTDGTEQTFLTRGGSPTWSADGKQVAFHRSASGTGLPILPFPDAATSDSDIFVAKVGDLVEGEQPRNLTNNPAKVDDDPDWSSDGTKIAFTSHDVNEPNPRNAVSAEIYVANAVGSGELRQVTHNGEEERGPAWSPDDTRLAYACRRGPIFEICVIDADGSNEVQLTSGGGLTPTWSPDGSQIVFARPTEVSSNQLFVMNADGTGLTQITDVPGINLVANWGELRVKVDR